MPFAKVYEKQIYEEKPRACAAVVSVPNIGDCETLIWKVLQYAARPDEDVDALVTRGAG